jgi:hypothetical protein
MKGMRNFALIMKKKKKKRIFLRQFCSFDHSASGLLIKPNLTSPRAQALNAIASAKQKLTISLFLLL